MNTHASKYTYLKNQKDSKNVKTIKTNVPPLKMMRKGSAFTFMDITYPSQIQSGVWVTLNIVRLSSVQPNFSHIATGPNNCSIHSIEAEKFTYIGEVDDKNNAFGIGVATHKESNKQYEGLFYKGRNFGICKCIQND